MNSTHLTAHHASSDIEPAGYTVHVDGAPVLVYAARVSAQPFNQVWAGYQRPLDQTEMAAFAIWDMTRPAQVTVVSDHDVASVRVRPSAAGITPKVNGRSIQFHIDKPGQYTVEVNGMHEALHLFASPPETAIPAADAPNVRWFGPGEHDAGLMRLAGGQTIYLAPGAVVHGAVIAENADHIAIRGRGILDGSRLDRMDVTGLICLYKCSDVVIEGVTLRDAGGWTVVPVACERVSISNIKIIGNWRYNSDGVDFVNCSHCWLEDSFVRTFDDCVCLKGYENFGPFIYKLQLVNKQWDGSFSADGVTRETFHDIQDRLGIYRCDAGPITDITVRRCVLWNDWGRALEIGAETVADEISGVRFEDCDVIHASSVALDIQNTDRAHCRDITFNRIRVELDDAAGPEMYQNHKDERYSPPPGSRAAPVLIACTVSPGYASYDSMRGDIQGVRFSNIDVTAPQTPRSRLEGFDGAHTVAGVVIENLRINGKIATGLEAAGITQNPFTTGISVGALPVNKAARRVLILGNSITLHPPAPEIGWTGDWGMAASAANKDYVHLLLQRFTDADGGNAPESLVENIADYERNWLQFDTQAVGRKYAAFQPGIVILAIGENVAALTTEQQVSGFESSVCGLLNEIQSSGEAEIFIRSSFWPDAVKDSALKAVAELVGGTFVDISAEGANPANFARSERSIENEGVAAHPGDRGMLAIADAIWAAIRLFEMRQ